MLLVHGALSLSYCCYCFSCADDCEEWQDSVFPGIGMPAVAASGMVAANTGMGLETLSLHNAMLDELRV